MRYPSLKQQIDRWKAWLFRFLLSALSAGSISIVSCSKTASNAESGDVLNVKELSELVKLPEKNETPVSSNQNTTTPLTNPVVTPVYNPNVLPATDYGVIPVYGSEYYTTKYGVQNPENN
jgi:hypothetical protein